MRTRLSARLLVLDPSGRILLFRFVHRNGALTGQDYWATPGGGVEDGETFEQAAIFPRRASAVGLRYQLQSESDARGTSACAESASSRARVPAIVLHTARLRPRWAA